MVVCVLPVVNVTTFLLIIFLEYDEDFDTALHLIDEHNMVTKPDFSNSYRIFILDTVSPKALEISEHKFIHKLKTLKPFGINTQNPFSIPLLNF